MEWLYALLGAAFLGLIGLVWHQMNEKIKSHKEHCDDEIEALWTQIGKDSDHGMRLKVHNSTPMGAHMDLERRVTALEIKQGGDR